MMAVVACYQLLAYWERNKQIAVQLGNWNMGWFDGMKHWNRNMDDWSNVYAQYQQTGMTIDSAAVALAFRLIQEC